MAKTKNKTEAQINQKPNTGKYAALPFGKGNYRFMLLGIALIVVGFFIMTMDKEEFGFGFLGLTLGPLIVFAGFMVEVFAILKKKDA